MINLSKIKPFLIYDFRSETELVREIEKLSQRFNVERDRIDMYVKSEKSVAAYTCFYGLTNMAKLKTCLEKVSLSSLKDYELIDIGAGPGTFSLAALELNPKQDLLLLERSEVMLTQAKKLLGGLHPEAKINFVSRASEIPQKSKKRLGLFGHSANEMEIEGVKEYVKKLDLDEILFIEPGTKNFFEKMRELRTWLLSEKFAVKFPCPNTGECPVSGEDWCHQYINVRHDHEVERLCQLVKRDRRLMPLVLHHYSRSGEDSSRGGYIIQRVLAPLKFAQPIVVCHQEDNLVLDRVEVVFKGLSKSEQKSLQKIFAGDKIELEPIKQLNPREWRAKWIFKTSQEDDS